MRKRGGRLAVLLALAVASACAAGGSTAATSPSSGAPASSDVSSSTTTTNPTTTSTKVNQEEAVKAAYLAYWKMLDRLFVAPNPDDPEIVQRVLDPALSPLRDELATRRFVGQTTEFPSAELNSHQVMQVKTQQERSTLVDCFIDGRVDVRSDGSRNADVVTKKLAVTLIIVAGSWKVTSVTTIQRAAGVQTCAA